MTGPVFTGTSLSLRNKIEARRKRYQTALALCPPLSRRAQDYRNSIAMLDDLIAAIERHRQVVDPPLVPQKDLVA